MKRFLKKHIKTLAYVIFLLSILELVYVLVAGDSTNEVVDSLPGVFVLTLVSEALFIVGLIVMAYAVEHELGKNPLKWRKHLKKVIRQVPNSRIFWVGFWINAIGALATGIIWLGAVILSDLPLQTWGILWLPISDILLTISLRASIIELKNEKIIG